nr:DUF559 domain-containing protein [Pseudonocardia acidicola]
MGGPFRGSVAIGCGLVTAGALRGPRYRRLFPDVYLAAEIEPTLAVRSQAGYLLVAHRGGALAGYSAAALLGAECAPGNAPAEVVVPAGALRARPGLLVRRERLDPADVLMAAGCRVTSPQRTAWDLARRLELTEAVVAVDTLARGRFAPTDLLARRSREPGARNCRAVERVVELADPRAESPMETRLRLILVLGGLPVPEVQYRVRDEHDFVIARVDLAYPEARLAIEYDGATHFTRERSKRDRRRDAVLADLGWDTLRFVDDDVLWSRPQTVHTTARRRAARLRAVAPSATPR